MVVNLSNFTVGGSVRLASLLPSKVRGSFFSRGDQTHRSFIDSLKQRVVDD